MTHHTFAGYEFSLRLIFKTCPEYNNDKNICSTNEHDEVSSGRYRSTNKLHGFEFFLHLMLHFNGLGLFLKSGQGVKSIHIEKVLRQLKDWEICVNENIAKDITNRIDL